MKYCILVFEFCSIVLAYWQSDYTIVHERIQIDFINKSYIGGYNFTPYYFKRYEKRLNISLTLTQNLGNEITNAAQAYKFQSNEYREFPVLYEGNACDVWKHDTFGTNPSHFETNFHGCPIKKGYYYVRNGHLDDRRLPPFAPRGRYMIKLSAYHGKNRVAAAEWYFKIIPTNPLEKRM